MTQAPDANATRFSLLVNQYPAAQGIYFRAIASASGSVDSLSNLIGPYTLISATPPVITITSPAPSGSDNGQDVDHPILIATDANGVANFNISVSATVASNRSLKNLSILYDGSTRASFKDGNSTATLTYHTDVLGVHVVEAVGVDDLNATGRAGTGPLFVRIAPASASAVKQNQARGRTVAGSASNSGKVFTLAKDGLWTDPAAWTDSQGNSGVPGLNDLAIISSSTVTIDGSITQDIEVGSALINGGHISVPSNSEGILKVDHFLTMSGGSIDRLHLQIPSTATCLMINDVDFLFTGTVSNSGTWLMHGRGGLVGLLFFANTGASEFEMPLIPPAAAGPSLALDGRIISTAALDDSGIIHASLITQDGGSLVSHDGGTLVSHDGGTVITENGAGLVTDGGSGLIGQDGGSLITQDGGSLITQDGGSLIGQDGGSLVGNSGGTFKVGGASSARNSSNVRAATAASGFTQTAGETDLSSVHIIGPVTLNGGILSGSGIIIGNLTNNSGYISPGHSAGFIAVTGNFSQNSGGTLIVEAAGGEANQFDRLQVGGRAILGGKLDLRTINGYIPLAGDPFNPLGYNSASGSFSSVSSNAQTSVNATGIVTTLDPAAPNPSTGQPLNIATRMSVQTGDNVLIAGFIVAGPSGSTKKVLIRGLGPSLAPFGVPNTLADPLLELHNPDGSVVSNDNWQQGDTSQIPNGFAPSDPREAVIVATLAPGNYSAVVKGAHGETGVGIAELYDLDSASPAKLANISTRGFINTGDDVMIGGFIIGGNEPAKILVRAIGPTLTDFGVQGALADPTLELHDSNGMTIANDDWRETQESEIIATTIPPNKDQEPAILATLAPGNYTAVVRGKNNTTGVGLVEAYNLQ